MTGVLGVIYISAWMDLAIYFPRPVLVEDLEKKWEGETKDKRFCLQPA